jgi:hypothetical protein
MSFTFINKIKRVNINDFEKSELINFALHKHRIFLMCLIENNIFIHPEEKHEQYVNIDYILHNLYYLLMNDNTDTDFMAHSLLQNGYAHNFLWFCEDYNLFQNN